MVESSSRIIRLAVISSNYDTVDAVRRAAAPEGWRVIAKVSGHYDLAALVQQRADVAIIDLANLDALQLIEDAAKALPDLPLIALATPERFGELQRAMLAGARGFVRYPLVPTEFVAMVRNILQEQEEEEAATPHHVSHTMSVAITGLKGGVGKTTIATNLAIALHQLSNQDVILVEAHNNLSDLALMLNLQPHHTLTDLAGVTQIDTRVLKDVLQKHSSGIHVLSNTLDVSATTELDLQVWNQLLIHVNEMAPIVVVDTAPTPDLILSEVLRQADKTFIIATPTVPSLRRALDLFDTISGDESFPVEPHVVINKSGMPGGIAEKQVKDRLGKEIFHVLPYDASLATLAMNSGVPFVISQPRSRLSRDIFAMAERLLPQAKSEKKKASGKSRKGLLNLRFRNT